MLEPPLRERLLVLEQRLGEEEQDAGPGPGIQLIECQAFVSDHREEKRFQCRTSEGVRDDIRNLTALLERLHEGLVPLPGRRLDGAELHALRAARRAEVAAEGRE